MGSVSLLPGTRMRETVRGTAVTTSCTGTLPLTTIWETTTGDFPKKLLICKWAQVALMVERRTHDRKDVCSNPESSSYCHNEARATNRWQGQDPQEPLENIIYKKTFP